MVCLYRPRMIRLFVVLFFVLFISAFGVSSFAGKSMPDEQAPPTDEFAQCSIPEGKYVYKFDWNGIPSAESEMLVTLKNKDSQPYYCFDGTARTSKFVDIFWRLRAHIVAFVDALTGRTVKIDLNHQQNKKMERAETVFDYESSEAVYTKWKKGEVKQKTIRMPEGTIDPMSLCLLVSQQKMQVGDSNELILLLEDDAYKVRYNVAEQERIIVGGCDFDALRIEPSFSRMEKKDKPTKVDLMTFWVTASEPHVPLKVQCKTFIGHVNGELVNMVPVARLNSEISST
jgi:hypothetical protein